MKRSPGAAVLLAVMLQLGCDAHRAARDGPWLEFDWAEADALFQRDRHWVGGDGAYSIDLGEGRVLWMFGDSWIDSSGRGSRAEATMVSNSLAIQRGYDPSTADIEFFWRSAADRPAAYFPDVDDRRYWPGHGVRIGDRLLLFLMEVQSREDGLGFEVVDWRAVFVRNPGHDPDEWDLQWLDGPTNDMRVIVGSGGVVTKDGFVYAFSSQEPNARHDVYLVRWPESDVRDGRLERMEWWAGDAGWLAHGDREHAPTPVFRNGQTEFTIHYDEATHVFVEIQTMGFGKAAVVRRTATKLTGPWSMPDTIFTPAQQAFPQILIYQGKAHPHLVGARLVVTYCTNSMDFADHLSEPWLYYPRFARIQ